jgi:hypothetical protein
MGEWTCTEGATCPYSGKECRDCDCNDVTCPEHDRVVPADQMGHGKCRDCESDAFEYGAELDMARRRLNEFGD